MIKDPEKSHHDDTDHDPEIKNIFLTSGLLLKSGIVWYTHTNDESKIGA